jgi:hypothetical protein
LNTNVSKIHSFHLLVIDQKNTIHVGTDYGGPHDEIIREGTTPILFGVDHRVHIGVE